MAGHEWEQSAACTGADVNAWFPSTPNGGAEAKRTCWNKCPVREQCLAAAMTEEHGAHRDRRHGIRGGLTAGERADLADRLDRQQDAA